MDIKILRKYQKILKYLFILISIIIFFLNSYFKEYLYTGSQSDLNSFDTTPNIDEIFIILPPLGIFFKID